MLIQLKQSEIVTALKEYISKQGINIKGKEVSMQFTAGRKESGISVEIGIEDTDIPGFGATDPERDDTPVVVMEENPAPLAEVSKPAKKAEPTPSVFAITEEKIEAPLEEVREPSMAFTISEPSEEVALEVSAPKKTTSLFS